MKKKEVCIINSELRNDRFTCHIIFLLRILRYLTVTSLVFSPILAVFQASEGHELGNDLVRVEHTTWG